MKNIPNTKFKQKYILYCEDWLHVYKYVHLPRWQAIPCCRRWVRQLCAFSALTERSYTYPNDFF